MSITGRFVAHFGADINYVRVFDEKVFFRATRTRSVWAT